MSLERPHNAFCVVTETPEDTLHKFNHRSRGCIGKAAKRRHWKSWRCKLRKHRREARWAAKSQRLIANGISALRNYRAAQKLATGFIPSTTVDEDFAASSNFKGTNGTSVATKYLDRSSGHFVRLPSRNSINHSYSLLKKSVLSVVTTAYTNSSTRQ